MTGRRWVLVMQAFSAIGLLILALRRLGLGFQRPAPDSTLDPQTVTLTAVGVSLWILLAAVGILRRRAWGYFMEIPVILLTGLFIYFIPNREVHILTTTTRNTCTW